MKTEKFQANLIDIQSNMLNFAYMLTSNRDAAYDLLQDTTSAVIKRQCDLSDQENFKNWVMATMRTIYEQHYRHTDHTAMRTVDSGRFALKLNASTPHLLPEGTREVTALQASLNRCPESGRKVFLLHAKGYTKDEIRQMTHIPLQVITSLIIATFKRIY